MDLFGTAGIRGPVVDDLTPELAVRVGRAVAGEADETVVVGRDGRTSSPALADAVAAGLASGGARVRRAGTVPTPALAYASRGRTGVMVTASHNPPEDNGLKCFADGEEYASDAEARIEAAVADGTDVVDWSAWTATERVDPLPAYRGAVRAYAEAFGSDPDGLTVAVDCGNGTGALATPRVLSALGADVRALEANVDGGFPARESKPTPESLAALCSFVPAVGADLGVAHDGDGDRIAVVDGDGGVIHEDTVVAILAETYVASYGSATDRSTTRDTADPASVGDESGSPVVVTTPNASGRVDERVSAAGGTTERVRLGALHEGIAVADGPVAFAAEPWKHIHPAHGPWIDGIASAAVFVRLVAASGVDGLREPVTERPYRKLDVGCPDGAKADAMAELRDALPSAFPDAALSTEHGVGLSLSDGSWVLVRPSGTEPYLRVYAESGDVDDLADAVVEVAEDAVSRVT